MKYGSFDIFKVFHFRSFSDHSSLGIFSKWRPTSFHSRTHLCNYWSHFEANHTCLLICHYKIYVTSNYKLKPSG